MSGRTRAVPVGRDVWALLRPALVLCGAAAGMTAAGCAALTAMGIAAALAWHLTAWAWREPPQVLVLALAVGVGVGLWRMDRAAREHDLRAEPAPDDVGRGA